MLLAVAADWRWPVKVLFLIGRLDGGGAERQLRQLATALAAQGDDVIVALLTRDAALPAPALAGVTVVALRSAAEGWWRALRRFRDLAVQTEVIYSFMDAANVFAALALAGRPRPLLWGLRSAGFPTARGARLVAWMGARLSRRVPVAVANAAAVEGFYRGLGYRPQRWARISNGVDTRHFAPSPAVPLGAPARAPLVAMVARADPLKGQAVFLRLVGELQQRFASVRWIVAGAGTEDPQGVVLSRRQTLPEPERLEVLGPVADVAALLRRCDLLVSCSSVEGSSNVILEALASEVPVVAYAAGDAATLLSGCGVAVPVGAFDELVRAVSELLLDPQRRLTLGRHGRRRVVAAYSVPAMVQQTRRLLSDCVSAASEDLV